MRKTKIAKFAISFLLFIIVVSTFAGTAHGDGGIISPYYVYEYAQSAVIAWNGDREYLALEVGIRAGFTTGVDEIKALRIIPLPSLPKVISVNDEVFKNIFHLISEKDNEVELSMVGKGYASYNNSGAGGGGGSVIYYGSVGIGPHMVGLFKILTPGNMTEKVRQVLEEMGVNYSWSPDPYGEEILDRYIKEGYNYFAFDYITVNKEVPYDQKIEPVGFIFNSAHIYYPVEITFLNPRNYVSNTIALYVITSKGVNLKSTNLGEFKWEKRYRVSSSEIRSIDSNIASIVNSGYMDVFLAYHLTRGTKVWNFEGMPNTVDPYLEKIMPMFVAFGVIAFLSLIAPFIHWKKRIKRKAYWEMIVFGFIILLLIISLYLTYIHYTQISSNVVSYYYSTPKARVIHDYYFTEMYIILTLSLAFLVLSFKLKNKVSVLVTLLSVLWGVTVALAYAQYIKLPSEVFGISMAFFLVFVLPYLMKKGFTTTGYSFQKKLSLSMGIPLFIMAFLPTFQAMDMVFYALFMGLTYLQGEVKFLPENK